MVSCKKLYRWLMSFVDIFLLWGLYFIRHAAQIIIPKDFAFLKHDSHGDSTVRESKRSSYRKVIHTLINNELCKQYPQNNKISTIFQSSHNKFITLQNFNEQYVIAMLSQELEEMKKNLVVSHLQVNELKAYKILLEIKYSLLSYEVKVRSCDMKSTLVRLTKLKNEYYKEASITEQLERNIASNAKDFILLENVCNEHGLINNPNSVNGLQSLRYKLSLKSRVLQEVSHRGLKILHKPKITVPTRMKLKFSDIGGVLLKNQIQLYRPAIVGENLSFMNTNLWESVNRGIFSLSYYIL